MGHNFSEATNAEFLKAVEESSVIYRVGKRLKGSVISADEHGVKIRIGGKLDGFIPAKEAAEGSYDPAAFRVGDPMEAIVLSNKDSETNCVLLSKVQVDRQKEGNKFVEEIRDGTPFEVKITSEVKGGLMGRVGSYDVFVPASHVSEKFTQNLKQYVGQTVRLVALEIDDERQRVKASARKILEAERRAKEDVFWTHIKPNVVVSGKVKRMTNFGAFVSVDGFDCLAHVVDLSWNRIKSPDEVLALDEEYDFVVLTVDKEKRRVGLGYKQLRPHPLVAATEKYPEGTVTKGKVVRIVPFGAFVELEPGVDGLLHISEASHTFVKNVSEVLKVGEEIEVMVTKIDTESHKITLSAKACSEPPPETATEEEVSGDTKKPRKGKKAGDTAQGPSAYTEEQVNNPLADLLKDFDANE